MLQIKPSREAKRIRSTKWMTLNRKKLHLKEKLCNVPSWKCKEKQQHKNWETQFDFTPNNQIYENIKSERNIQKQSLQSFKTNLYAANIKCITKNVIYKSTVALVGTEYFCARTTSLIFEKRNKSWLIIQIRLK